MKERGTLFTAPMIRAKLAGLKTQTRRPLKMSNCLVNARALNSRSTFDGINAVEFFDGFDFKLAKLITIHDKTITGEDIGYRLSVPHSIGGFIPISPRWQVGDKLWWKETVAQHPELADVAYRADGDEYEDSDGFLWVPAWTPAIHMHRKLCRIETVLTSVRIERLLDIRKEDAKAEGLTCLSKDYGRTWKYGIPDRDGMPGNDDDGWHWQDWSQDPRQAYFSLWDSIYGEGAHKLNPWVIVGEWVND
jgi:hypothetical protein